MPGDRPLRSSRVKRPEVGWRGMDMAFYGAVGWTGNGAHASPHRGLPRRRPAALAANGQAATATARRCPGIFCWVEREPYRQLRGGTGGRRRPRPGSSGSPGRRAGQRVGRALRRGGGRGRRLLGGLRSESRSPARQSGPDTAAEGDSPPVPLLMRAPSAASRVRGRSRQRRERRAPWARFPSGSAG